MHKKKELVVARAEAELIRFVADRGQATVREIEVEYGRPRSLSRGTIVKAVFRLHEKGLLARKKRGAVFVYSSPVDVDELDVRAVRDLFQSRLQGRIAPVLSYLTETRELSKDELRQIRDAINKVLKE